MFYMSSISFCNALVFKCCLMMCVVRGKFHKTRVVTKDRADGIRAEVVNIKKFEDSKRTNKTRLPTI